MARINVRDIVISAGIIGLSVFMIFNLLDFQSSVAGTIGPGIYPLITLLLLIVTGLMIVLKSFVPIRFRLISPFPPGSRQGMMAAETARILAQEINSRITVQSATGQGFFSARHIGARAKSDGTTLCIITGDKPTPSYFYNAFLHLKDFNPITLLSHDPEVFIVKKSDSLNEIHPISKVEFIDILSSGRIGFSHQQDTIRQLTLALHQETEIDVQPTIFESTQLMLESLAANRIIAAVCPLSDLAGSEDFERDFHLLAVGTLERLVDFPDIPTLEELEVNLVWGAWIGLAFSSDTASDKVQGIWEILKASKNFNLMKNAIRQNGGRDAIHGPVKFRRLLEGQQRVWKNSHGSAYGDQGMAPLLKVVAAIGLFAVFMVLGPYVGYLPVSLFFMLSLSLILWPGNRKRAFFKILVASLFISICIYFIFTYFFNVAFP